MRGTKILFATTALLAGLALAPAAQAQIYVGVGIQPVCSYGYYDYSPYACAPYGFYGPGYFYNGIFLGMGPWAGWGYGHGWGGHRFVSEGGGSYHGGGGAAANRSNFARSGGQSRGNSAGHPVVARASAPRPQQAAPSHAAAPRATESHAPASHATESHAPASHAAPGGGESHGGGGHEGGGH